MNSMVMTQAPLDNRRGEPSVDSPISSIEDILEDARNGRPYILVDAEERENEGDICIPAQMATPDVINFMARYGRGLICLSLTKQRAQELRLPPMVTENGARNGTAFTVSIEAKEGISTGISAHDRARTVSVAIDATKSANDIASPGHVFPLISRDGGVLVRAGHTEAVVDISKIAGLNPSGVICEVMNDDGTMARLPDLIAFSQLHGLKIGTIADLIAYRRRTERFVERVFEIPQYSKRWPDFKIMVYRNSLDNCEHLALIKGHIQPSRPTLVRMHQFDLATDVLDSNSIDQAMEKLTTYDGAAAMVLLRDPDPQSLSKRFGALPAATTGRDLRDYGIGAQILLDLGVQQLIGLSNSKPKLTALEGYGLTIVEWKGF